MDRLSKCEANYVPLTPLSFLKRAGSMYANRTSIIYENTRFTWRQTYERCCRLASSLRSLNILNNHVVSVLAPNVPAMYEMHFAVPMAGAVLNTINSRLDAKNVATILRHSEAKALFVDYQYVQLASEALRILMADSQQGQSSMPLVIVIDDVDSPTGVRLGELEYEQLIQMGNPRFVPIEVQDEWDPISLNYTSGTTSEPKGVVYSHRGAYLSTLSLILGWEMGNEPVYLWSLPMFHCNGWTFTWGIAARGGTNVCILHQCMYTQYHRVRHVPKHSDSQSDPHVLRAHRVQHPPRSQTKRAPGNFLSRPNTHRRCTPSSPIAREDGTPWFLRNTCLRTNRSHRSRFSVRMASQVEPSTRRT
ncbi:hypothetical protein ERO13_A08G038401v2 [Gossypium hirsutum]|nr:hypothetical protein ERO13_A08G038401v2 [Gossypium hirsutum]